MIGLVDEKRTQNGLVTAKEDDRRQNCIASINTEPALQWQNIYLKKSISCGVIKLFLDRSILMLINNELCVYVYYKLYKSYS